MTNHTERQDVSDFLAATKQSNVFVFEDMGIFLRHRGGYGQSLHNAQKYQCCVLKNEGVEILLSVFVGKYKPHWVLGWDKAVSWDLEILRKNEYGSTIHATRFSRQEGHLFLQWFEEDSLKLKSYVIETILEHQQYASKQVDDA